MKDYVLVKGDEHGRAHTGLAPSLRRRARSAASIRKCSAMQERWAGMLASEFYCADHVSSGRSQKN
ncbi:hypothetical protein PSM7751_01227 [Pseudooceanicola marinus]|uniref:Uncharacterized protein n=1 Tax=Pseudooceanicola marinus TaxID=396013 RepID=A0A1X6YSA2_9RHOB|nr:hypothetical protein PSM7751_01227 [Pseudooceanicola marinus]